MATKTINQITAEQTVFNDTDSFELQEDAGTSKKTVWSTIKSQLKAYFDTLYGPNLYPVGSFYVQYPDAASNDDATAFPVSARPATMFGGTWVEQFNTEGVVFQTAGYDGAGRTNGLMADQFQGFRMSYNLLFNNGGTGTSGIYSNQPVSVTPAGLIIGTPITDGVNGVPRPGSKTSHTNRLAKYWKRTVL